MKWWIYKLYYFHMQAHQENIRKDNFYIPEYGISISQSCVHIIKKLEPNRNIMLHVFS